MGGVMPLEGIKVISFCNFVAGPTASRYLSEWGAEVIKIENVEGDPWRYYGPACRCPATDQENPLFDLYNAHKKDIALNLKDPQGREILFQLLKDADVFLTNTRPHALKKLGLDYDSMKERFPELIYAQLTGYGQDGPDCDQPGYDSVAFYSRSGLLADTMEPGGYPPIPPGCVGDITTGTALFGGICAALLGRARTGKGDHIEVSLYGMALFACSTLVTFTQPQYNELYPKPRNQMKPMTTYYRCSDGEWLTLTVLQPEKQFKGLCEALGIPEVGDDPRFQRRDDIILHKAELLPVLEEAFAKFSSSEITARLKEKNIVADRMRHFREQYKDPQALANDFMRPFTFESGNEAVMTMTPIKSANVGRVAFERGPLLGEHTDEILHTLHYSDEEIGRLKQEKVVK